MRFYPSPFSVVFPSLLLIVGGVSLAVTACMVAAADFAKEGVHVSLVLFMAACGCVGAVLAVKGWRLAVRDLRYARLLGQGQSVPLL